MSAKDNPVFILCLGAPVEFDMERYLPGLPETAATVNTDPNPPPCQGVVGEEVCQKGKKPKKPKTNPTSGPSPVTNIKPGGKKKGKQKTVVSRPKPKPAAPAHERLKIRMVHGDVLILNGWDFIVRPLPALSGKYLKHRFCGLFAVHAHANGDVYL